MFIIIWKFVHFKNKGGLTSWYEGIFKIIIETEKVHLNLSHNLTVFNVSDLKRQIVNFCSNKISLDIF